MVSGFWDCVVIIGGVGTEWLVVVFGLSGKWWCWDCAVSCGVGTE